MQVDGMFVAAKSIQSAASIHAGNGVNCGDHYGIFAGLCVPDTLHTAHRYVAAPAEPARIRSGIHTTGMRFKKLSDRQLVGWPADDNSDGTFEIAGQFI